jgi:hypothetical protein
MPATIEPASLECQQLQRLLNPTERVKAFESQTSPRVTSAQEYCNIAWTFAPDQDRNPGVLDKMGFSGSQTIIVLICGFFISSNLRRNMAPSRTGGAQHSIIRRMGQKSHKV